LRFAVGGRTARLLLVGFLRGWPFDFALEVDAFGDDPFIETFVEFFVVDVEGESTFPAFYLQNFRFAFFTVLLR